MKNTYLQLIQMITGVLVALLLGLHIAVMHLDAVIGFFGVNVGDTTSWDSMIERARMGLWVGVYIALLVFGLFHALNGLRNILLETNISSRSGRVVTGVIIAFGAVFLLLGIYVPLVLVTK